MTADGLTVIEGNIGEIVRRFGSFYVNNNLIAKWMRKSTTTFISTLNTDDG